MLENDGKFTPKMRRRLGKKFGFIHSPRAIAEDADDFLRSNLPSEGFKIDPYKMPKGMEHILTTDLFVRRFLEEQFSEIPVGDIRQQSKSFLLNFYLWQDSMLDEFRSRKDDTSEKCIGMIEGITLEQVYDFTASEARRYRSYRDNRTTDTVRYLDAGEQAPRWENYANIAHGALIKDRLMKTRR